MTRSASVPPSRTLRLAAAAVVLLGVVLLARGASALPSTQPTSTQDVVVTLEQSATALPADGDLGYTAVIRLPAAASYVQGRLQVHNKAGRLVFQRTQVLGATPRGVTRMSFSRPLAGLGLSGGSYPVTFSLRATVGGSDVATDLAQSLRVYDPKKPRVPLALIVKVHVPPYAGPDGHLVINPALQTKARDDIETISSQIVADPAARITLAIPPLALEEWKRFSTDGYTLASGTVVPASDPVAVSYGAALARLQQALGTGRLELTTLGYVDPSLSDLVANKLGSDAALQYDTGISACFTSIETTPSGGTAPAGGCIPPEVASALSTRGVTWAAADSDRTRLAGKPANSGVYRVAGSTISALVLDTPAGRGLESGDASATLGRTFDRMSFAGTPQPFATRIDLSQDTLTASETVLPALAAIEDAVWLRPVLGGEIRPGKGTRTITYAPVATPNAPAKFWPTVRNARLDAQGLLAVLGTGEPSATSAQRQSLLAESSSWSDPNATWLGAPRGLAFATSAIRTAKALFDQIKITAVSLTLAGAKGEVPITVTNGSNKTLSVVVRVRATNGVQISGGRRIDANLPPRDTFIPIPIDMKSALSSKVTVEVVAGRVVIAKKVVSVRRSYLDRLALIGGIVLVLGGLLIWIVRRVSTSPELVDIDATPMDDEQPAPSDAEHDPAADQPTQELPPVARDRDQDVERYTESDVRDDGEEPR